MKKWLRFGLFTLITTSILCALNFLVFKDNVISVSYTQFYQQKENSLDLVSIGNSTINYGINPLYAWKEFQVTSYDITDKPMHLESIIIAIDEVGRTQKPKVVYVDLHGLTNQTSNEQESFVKRYFLCMPEGEAKEELKEKYPYLKNLSNDISSRLFRGHNSFRNPQNYEKHRIGDTRFYKGFEPATHVAKDIEMCTLSENKIKKIPDSGKEYLKRILETCKKYPSTKFVFGLMPRFINKRIVGDIYCLRSIIKDIEKQGFEYVEWQKYFLDMKLDPQKDAMDEYHLNEHGAIKFTKFYIEYLDKKYQIKEKPHDEDVVQNFNDCLKKYKRSLEE